MNESNETVILTIDDESIIRDTIRAYLEDFDYTVVEAENGRIGLEIEAKQKIDLILVDLRMPEVDGLEVLSRVRRRSPDLPIIVISGTGEIEDVVEALRLGAWDYLLKPITDMSILLHAIDKVLERARLIKENQQYNKNLKELVSLKTRELSVANARLQNVVESTKKLIGCGQLPESGPLLLQEFARHMDATGGNLYQVTPDGLQHIAGLGSNQVTEIIPFPLPEDSVFAKIMTGKEPLFLADIQGDGSVVANGGNHYRDNSLLVFPIADRNGEIYAIVSLHSKKEPPFISQDRDIGKILASYSSEVLQVAEVSAALQKSEARLLQAQKMEAIGTLAGGIAHDFNNILAAIVGYTDLSLFSGSCDAIVKKNLEQVKKASNRAKDLVSQILSFSRTEEFQEDAVDIGPIVKEALKLLRATLPSSIVIDFSIPNGLGRVMTDPTKIYQVLMNLCTNAAHAMQNQEGILRVDYSSIEEQHLPVEIKEHRHRSWLRLSVSDTGVGVNREHLERIFDPYFTTKEKGEGTGLGLAVVHGIVRASGGMIKVESEVGKGSSFHLYFPAVQGNKKIADNTSFAQMKGGNETILFVDDETTLAEMAGEMLEKLGYTVTVFSNSTEALSVIEQDPLKFDLLITDQTMPDISGMDLAARVLGIRPDLPVILYTGYSAAIDGQEAKGIGIREFLMKPLSMRILADAVRRTLDS